MNKLKALIEKRNSLVEKMQGLIDKATTETRAFTEEEQKEFNSFEAEIRSLDETIKTIEKAGNIEKEEREYTTEEEKEIRAFDDFLRKNVESRAAGTFDIGTNGGAIIPTVIANKIIEKVKELSPIYSQATIYNVGGDLVFPAYDESTDTGAALVEDMEELTETAGKFTNIKLENNILGVLKLISKSLMNRTEFDLVGFVVNKVAENISEFLENALLNGSESKYKGVFQTENLVTAASATAITADELIDVQMTVPAVYQNSAVWLMNKDTFKKIRKLKNNDGEYLLNKDLTTPFGWTLLGKPVYISDNAPKAEAGKTVIVYGEMSGLYVKLAQGIEMQMLLEKYATKHAIGVVGYVEFDSKIVETQKLAGLKMAE